MDIKQFTDEVQLWNFKTNQFDEIGTEFSWDHHVNDNYHLEEQQQLMKDIINCGDHHYWATIIDGPGESLILTPGFWRINRLGYVIYKHDGPIADTNEFDV